MARAYKDGAGTTYNTTNNHFETVPFGVGGGVTAGNFFEIFSYGDAATTGLAAYKQKVDNSNAGVLRDCAECHVGGGMNEYAYANMSTAAYAPNERQSLRTFDFGTAVTAWNYFIDIFNTDVTKRGDVVKNDFAQTGVLEMDCLMCHQNGYDWDARKEAVRNGQFDASRSIGANLTNVDKHMVGDRVHVSSTGAFNGLSVFYNYTAVKTNASGNLYVDLSASLKGKPESTNCANCHQSQYNVDWKKRGEQWLRGSEVHYGMGCMACHERKDKDADGKINVIDADTVNGGVITKVGTTGLVTTKALGLCDPAKGGASTFDAMWNPMDKVNFKECSDCHEPAAPPTWPTYGAPASVSAHAAKGLTAKIAFDKNGAPASHMQIIDCTACHISKTFDGGAIVDGTGADEEGRVALHDEQQVARDMGSNSAQIGTAGNALYWDNGKLYAANLLTSSFVRDMNGMDTGGFDGNNDGRNAGMDTLLQTHVNNINNAAGAHAVTMHREADGSWVNPTEVGALLTRISGGIRAQLGVATTQATNPVIPKMSFLMVPFKASHNIARTATMAWGKNGCTDCHGENKGFYNGAYPVKGNMDGFSNISTSKLNFSFNSNQVTTFTKVNGLAEVTDSHPNVTTKKGDRSVAVKVLTKFDNPFAAGPVTVETLRNIDRSEVIYESTTFKTRNGAWYGEATPIIGDELAAACNSASPFYCGTLTFPKGFSTSTKGWLLKVEVRPVGGADSTITFRTAQLGIANATTMAEVVAALPASFTGATNPDFTVVAEGNAIKITAKSGKEIRLSTQTDAAAFGLLGKVYKEDPIVRNGVTVATKGSEYVTYLNGVSTDLAAYGIGVNPVAAINRLSDADVSAVQLGTQVVENTAVAISALDAQTAANGTVSYKWSAVKLGTCEDAYHVVTACYVDDTAPVFGDANAQTTTVTFPVNPTAKATAYTIVLTVTDEEGKTSTATADVTAIKAPMTIAWTGGAGFGGTATFSGLPAATTKVKVLWGDGTTTQKIDAPAKPAVAPVYYAGTTTVKIPGTPAVDAVDAVPASGIVAYSHTYATGTAKNIKLYCYDVDGLQIGYQQINILP